MASKIGDTRAANMVAVGALTKNLRIFPMKTVLGALRYMLSGKEELFDLNKTALEKGYKVAR